VKSTVVMRNDLEELDRRGLGHYPVLLGGAALTRAYVEVDLRATYPGPLFYCRDAFAGLRVMEEVAAVAKAGDAEAAGLTAAWGREVGRRQASARTPAPAVAPVHVRSDVATDVAVPVPPFWGTRVVRGVPLGEISVLLNRTALFRTQWGYGRETTAQAEAALRDVLALARGESLLNPRAIYGYFACNGDGEDLVVYEGPSSDVVAARFTFPRQTAGRHLCIADFFRPRSSGERDVLAVQVVTMGRRVSQRAGELFAADRYSDYLALHGLGVEMAEAFAEHTHRRVRTELGIAGDDADTPAGLFRQGYRGSRYSFGYAACPDLEARKPLFDLLDAGRIDIELSEEFQLHPEQSTDALVVHHPEAKYFNAR